MAGIYNCAERVVIWLGIAQDADVAMELVRDLWSQISTPSGTVSARTELRWDALFKLLQHPWFERVWIIQEVVLGGKVMVVYGTIVIQWEKLSRVIELLGNPMLLESSLLTPLEKKRIQREFPDEMLTVRFMSLMENTKDASRRILTAFLNLNGLDDRFPEFVGDLREGAELVAQGGPTHDMFYGTAELLCGFSRWKATEPKDKTFALVGLSQEATRTNLVPGAALPLEWELTSLDYNLSALEVYVKVAMNLLLADSSIDRIPLHILPLAGIGHGRSFKALPTWAPDWSEPPNTFMLSFDRGDIANYRASGISCNHWHYGSKAALPPSAPYNMYEAEAAFLGIPDRRVRHYTHRGQVPYTIVWQGIEVDRLWQTGPQNRSTTYNPDFNRSNVQSRLQDWVSWHNATYELAQTLMMHFPIRYPTAHVVFTAYWRTLIGDRTHTTRPAPHSYSSYYSTQCRLQQSFLAKLEQLKSFNPSGNAQAEYEALVIEILDAQVTPVAIAERQASARRAFFITEKGAMALVPPKSQVGDKVCILLGAQTLFILRRCGEGVVESRCDVALAEKMWEDWCKEMDKTDRLESTRVKIVGDEIFDLVGESCVHGWMDGEGLAHVGRDLRRGLAAWELLVCEEQGNTLSDSTLGLLQVTISGSIG